jgi:hypothetical protein
MFQPKQKRDDEDRPFFLMLSRADKSLSEGRVEGMILFSYGM